MNQFRVWPLRFHFLALTEVCFPPQLATNTIRGALGSQLRSASCIPECSSIPDCPIQKTCPYAQIFEPRQIQSTPFDSSGLKDYPRPFVFRASHLDGLTIAKGQSFYFDLNLFLPPKETLPFLIISFRRLAETGLGLRGGRAFLSSVDATGSSGDPIARLFNGQAIAEAESLSLQLTKDPLNSAEVTTLKLQFLTPTEIKAAGRIETKPGFRNIFNRVMDRIAALARVYQEERIELDFVRLGEQALYIKEEFSEWNEVEVFRRSTKTGQRHGLGGAVGQIVLSGQLTELLPILIAGQFCGVGRHTAWGNGQYRLGR